LRDRANKKWDDFTLDSDEEYLFLSWYEEAESIGLIGNLVRQPEFPLSPRQAIQLKAPTKNNPDKVKERFLLHPHSYKADFSFETVMDIDSLGNYVPAINRLASSPKGHLMHTVYAERFICLVDVKGGFSNGRSANSSDITFPINQKWVYDKYGIFVNKAVINSKKGLFKEFWAPEEAFATIKGNPSKVYRTCARFADVKNLIGGKDAHMDA